MATGDKHVALMRSDMDNSDGVVSIRKYEAETAAATNDDIAAIKNGTYQEATSGAMEGADSQ